MFIRSLVHGDIADPEVLASLPGDNQRSCILAIFQVPRGRLGLGRALVRGEVRESR